MKDHNATLKNWYAVELGEKCILFGNIYEDDKGRFDDGFFIRTSLIETPVKDMKEGQVVQTMNTKYLLGEAYVPRK